MLSCAGMPTETAARRWLARLAFAGLCVHAAFLPLSIAGMQIGLGLSLAALLALALLGRRTWAHGPLDVPLLALAGAALLSIAVAWAAGSPPVGWHEATLWKSALSPLVVLSALSLTQPGAGEGGEAARRRALLALSIWAVFSLAPSALAWVQHYTAFDPLYALGLRPRPRLALAPRAPGRWAAMGFFPWYQRLAHNLTPPLLLAAALALHGGLPRRRRLLLGVAAAAAAAAVGLTMSRAAWVALAAGAGVLALAAGRRLARLALPAAAAVALALVLLNPSLRERLSHAADPRENADRGTIWEVCAAVVKDHPLAGVGFGNLPRRSLPYYQRLAPHYPLRAWCHDAFFSAWAEGGPILLGGLLLYWGGLIRAFVRRRRQAPSGPDGALARAAAAGALAGLVAMLLNSLAHDIFYASETMYGLGFALGIAAGLSRGEGSPSPGGAS